MSRDTKQPREAYTLPQTADVSSYRTRYDETAPHGTRAKNASFDHHHATYLRVRLEQRSSLLPVRALRAARTRCNPLPGTGSRRIAPRQVEFGSTHAPPRGAHTRAHTAHGQHTPTRGSRYTHAGIDHDEYTTPYARFTCHIDLKYLTHTHRSPHAISLQIHRLAINQHHGHSGHQCVASRQLMPA